MSTDAYNTIRSDLTYYNNTLAGGKWQKMMDPYNDGNGQPVIEGMPSLPAVPAASGTLGVAVEGQTTGNEATPLKFSVYTDDRGSSTYSPKARRGSRGPPPPRSPGSS